jgi:hypothetical protein
MKTNLKPTTMKTIFFLLVLFCGLGSLEVRGQKVQRVYGNSKWITINTPQNLPKIKKIVVPWNRNYTVALTSNHDIICWNPSTGIFLQTPTFTGVALDIFCSKDGNYQISTFQYDVNNLPVWSLNHYVGYLNGGYSNITVVSAPPSKPISYAYFLNPDGVMQINGNLQSFGNYTIPSGLTNLSSIAINMYHGLALKNDGSLVAWGKGFGTQPMTTIPSFVGNIKKIAVGNDHSVLLLDNGNVVSWQGNGYSWNVIDANGKQNVKDIAADGFNTFLLYNDNSIETFGFNKNPRTIVNGSVDGIYLPIGSETIYYTSQGYNQTINGLSATMAGTVGGSNISLANVTATSGLPVTLTSSNLAVASISGKNVVLTGKGVCTITAYQVGNIDYFDDTKTSVLTVSGKFQNIVMQTIKNVTLNGVNQNVTAVGIAISALPVSYSISSNPQNMASISGSVITVNNIGTVTVTGSQAGNNIYNAATPVSTVFNVTTLSSGILTQLETFNADSKDFFIYPNPNKGSFTVSSTLVTSFQIISLDGTLLQTGSLVQGENSIATKLSSGFYLFKVGNVSKKLLVE